MKTIIQSKVLNQNCPTYYLANIFERCGTGLIQFQHEFVIRVIKLELEEDEMKLLFLEAARVWYQLEFTSQIPTTAAMSMGGRVHLNPPTVNFDLVVQRHIVHLYPAFGAVTESFVLQDICFKIQCIFTTQFYTEY